MMCEIGPELPPSMSSPEVTDVPRSSSIGPHISSGEQDPFGVSKEASIGPQVSSHLSRVVNINETSEVELCGPAMPPIRGKDPDHREYIGPQLPMYSQIGEEYAPEIKSYGPALPPGYVNKNTESVIEKCSVIGPCFPNHIILNEDEDVDEIIGPTLPQNSVESDNSVELKAQFESRAKAMKNKLTAPNGIDNKQLERESWMLELPPEVGKNFGLGPRTFRSKAVDLGDRSVWTDTPADREKKLCEDSKDLPGNKRKADVVEPPTPEELEMRAHIEKYNKKTRPQSLLEMHQTKHRKNEAEENTRRPFDRDRDLALHRKDPKQMAKFIDGAKQMNLKFSAGNYESKFL